MIPLTDSNVERLRKVIAILGPSAIDEVAKLISERRAELNREVKSQLQIGSTVSFTHPKTHARLTGEVIKINPKKVKINVNGTIWTASPNHLTIE